MRYSKAKIEKSKKTKKLKRLKKRGKPRLKDYFVSFSHTDELVCVAVSKVNIGVDIEMDDGPAGSIILFVILIFLSGFFSGTEISLASVNRIHMMSKASKGKRSAKRVLWLLDNFDEEYEDELSDFLTSSQWKPADYDVDGVTSVSILYMYLKDRGVDVDYYIPTRESEGYGLNIGAFHAIKDNGTTLVITVDTGITALNELQQLHNGKSLVEDGAFAIENVPASATHLTVSFVGYMTEEVAIVKGQKISIVMKLATEALDEVVVTALGIRREQKALSYNVQTVKGDLFTANKDANFINSLAGKVAGVNISSSAAGAGSASRVIMRGTKSLSGNDNALYVIDGIPMFDINTGSETGGTMSKQPGSSGVADINPEDIESMSVLSGPSAAALYGSAAASGVILITTKKGAEGSVNVNVNSKLSTSFVGKTPEAQTMFDRGVYSSNGVLSTDTYSAWGQKIGAGTKIYDNIDGFFQNGIIWDNSVNVSGGHKNGSFFLSASDATDAAAS